MVIRMNREADLEADEGNRLPDQRFLNIALIVTVVGSNTTSRGGPRPVNGMEFN